MAGFRDLLVLSGVALSAPGASVPRRLRRSREVTHRPTSKATTYRRLSPPMR